MNDSREFFCPNGHSLQMSDSMHMLALVHRSGGNYMASATVDTVTCPGCGAEMRVQDIIEGKYDRRGGLADTIAGIVGLVLMIGGIVWLVRSCS